MYYDSTTSLLKKLKLIVHQPTNHNADYINKRGYYDLVKFFQDHSTIFKGLSKVFIGTLAPHITTEVDCESLFSQAGHALPIQAVTGQWPKHLSAW